MRLWHKIFIFSCLVAVISLTGSETQGSAKKRSWLPGWAKNIKEGKWPWKRRDDREFMTGKGHSLQMTRGDTIVSAWRPSSWWLKPPYRWMYAVDQNHVLVVFPGFSKFTKGKAKPRIINIRDKLKNIKLKNRRKKKGHIGVAGSLVAVLMAESKVELPFNMVNCNGKHYTEYLSMGKANQGSYLSLHYNKLGKRCPLREPLNENDAETIYISGKFTLKSKSKEYHLTLPGITSLPEGQPVYTLWPSYIREMNLFNSFGTN